MTNNGEWRQPAEIMAQESEQDQPVIILILRKITIVTEQPFNFFSSAFNKNEHLFSKNYHDDVT